MNFAVHKLVVLSLLIMFVLSACSSPGDTTASGELNVQIVGLPTGANPVVEVTGPNNYRQQLSAAETLTNLIPGTYSVTATEVNSGAERYTPAQARQDVVVRAGEMANVTVSYSRQAQAGAPGGMNLSISGLPTGNLASITVTGPNNYSQAVTGNTVLENLSPGSYTIAAAPVTSGSNSYIPDPINQEITILPNTTVTARVNYVLPIPGTGRIGVTISGLPNNTNADVTVAGPGGFNQNVTSSRTLFNLTPGTYTITASNITAEGNVYTTSQSPQTVTVNADATATATVSYTVQPGSLQVNVTGLPVGVNANVSVTGPGGFSRSVGSTTALNDLIPGSYTVSASSVTADGETYIPDSPSRSVIVTSAATATVVLNYVQRVPGSGSLTVNIVGLPEGTAASVAIRGANDVTETLTETGTLNNLIPGEYTVAANEVTIGGLTYTPAPEEQQVNVSADSIAAATVAYGVQPGNLQVNINGLPSGVNASVTVTGLGGYNQSITASETLNDLTPGEYTITAENVISDGNTHIPDPVSQTIAVASTTTATATIDYVLQEPDTGSLAVTITGLPEGIAAIVDVTGPTDYDENIAQSTTLTNLTPGEYLVAAAVVTVGEDTYIPDSPSQVLTITANATTTAIVNYVLQLPQIGSLEVTITGLPNGVLASVTVTGPGSYSQSVTESTTLANLIPGSYIITASNVTTNGNSYAPASNAETITVTAGSTTTVGIAYVLQPGDLQVTFTGLPAGTNPSVTVTGPGGYNQNLTESTTLTGLTPGEYHVVAENVAANSDTFIPDPLSQSLTVTSNVTATATIDYVLQIPELGSLAVIIIGLPGDVAATVTVTGPGGYNQNLVESTTLTDLTPGSYTITAGNVTGIDTTYAPSLATQTVTVTAGTTLTNISYVALTGNLQVNLTGLPAGVNAAVNIAGPSSYSQTVTGTTTLTGLTPGSYTIAANSVIDNGTTYKPAPSSRTIAVSAGATATATVIYECVVNIPDDALRALIRARLGKPSGDITCADMERITRISSQAEGVVNLEGLQYAKNLTSLYLAYGEIRDISPLAGLTKLVTLDLRYNEIRDISPLANLTNLMDLMIYRNEIRDISPLVRNQGIGNGDTLELRLNCLDERPGSQNMRDIQALVNRQVYVLYGGQRNLAQPPCSD